MEKKKYQIIYCDPPYPIKWVGSPSIGTKHISYKTMPISEICLLPVKDIAEDCSKIFLWTSNDFLPEMLGVLKHWGFTYNKLWTWCKKTGAGGHPRNATEHLIEATRGALKSIGRHESPKNNWFMAKKGIHSKKPEEARKIIEYCYPNTTKIELFARHKTEGWDVWGDEIESDIELNSEVKADE